MSDSRPGRLDHVALYVSQLAWYVDLFEAVFDMAVTEVDAGCPRQVWLDGGLQLVERNDAPPPAGILAHVALAVEDREQVTAALAHRGCVGLERGTSWWSLRGELVIELVDAAS